ncbi:DUF1104 domain-containing protein [Helicobacter heilmannii]|uniref:DUF1104 domain-containing protein n=1 Tax=Helicobacter heilmannii TaxID=35817 RepID=UPI0006A0CD29|nr:DUF1104 domain-containing protein [Helicobacter heilmannii]CRF47678.1 hypothetical protein HHE02_09730 [Helicobacter heilmannii]CRF50941.1 hypothetical protein HHE06_07990 [Helicobacter heilmannii]
MTLAKLKLGVSALVLSGLCSGLFAAQGPFESKSDKELIDMAGKVAPEQVPDYRMELYKRTKHMNPVQRKKFYDKVFASADKNTANMTMEDFGKRMEAIRAAMKARIAKMTRAQFKESGLFWGGPGMGPHGHGMGTMGPFGPFACHCGEHHNPHNSPKPPKPSH